MHKDKLHWSRGPAVVIFLWWVKRTNRGEGEGEYQMQIVFVISRRVRAHFACYLGFAHASIKVDEGEHSPSVQSGVGREVSGTKSIPGIGGDATATRPDGHARAAVKGASANREYPCSMLSGELSTCSHCANAVLHNRHSAAGSKSFNGSLVHMREKQIL